MDKDKQTVHYCTILSGEQWDFILEGRFSAQRQRCLHRLMTHAVRTKTGCNIKGIEIALEVGYENPAKFSSAFKNEHQITPAQFRKYARARVENTECLFG